MLPRTGGARRFQALTKTHQVSRLPAWTSHFLQSPLRQSLDSKNPRASPPKVPHRTTVCRSPHLPRRIHSQRLPQKSKAYSSLRMAVPRTRRAKTSDALTATCRWWCECQRHRPGVEGTNHSVLHGFATPSPLCRRGHEMEAVSSEDASKRQQAAEEVVPIHAFEGLTRPRSDHVHTRPLYTSRHNYIVLRGMQAASHLRSPRFRRTRAHSAVSVLVTEHRDLVVQTEDIMHERSTISLLY